MVLHGLSAVAMVVFVYLFISHNEPGQSDVPVIAILAGIYVAIFLLATPGLVGGRHVLLPESLSRVLYAVTAVALPLLFLNDAMWDEYHVVSFFDGTVIALLLSWLLLVISSVISFSRGQRQFILAGVVALFTLVFVLLVRMTIQAA